MRERRQAARLVESVHFKLGNNTYDLTSSTINVSTNGILCRVSEDIPIMTKLNMVLMIPRVDNKGKPHRIRARGVVVRSTDDVEGLKKIAIFFTDLSDNHKKYLDSFIQSKLKEKGEAP